MNIARTRTTLLRTSAATDVKRGGSDIAITGLERIFAKDIIKVTEYKKRAEVVKVETIGSSSYTPVASTTYIVNISLPIGRHEGYSTAYPRVYSYVTPATLTDIGATAALQREYIHVQLIAAINADTGANFVTAVTLATGTGFTITDAAGYFPAKTAAGQSSRAGASNIFLPRDSNGRGFVDASDRTITTNAVYAFGVGADLLANAPVVYALGGGNIIAGEVDGALTVAGLPAVSGQNYNAFYIESLVRSEIPTISNGTVGYRVQKQMIFVDNGTGSSTANLAGFKAFQRQMHKLMFLEVYGADQKSVIEYFDKPIVFQDPLGAAPTGTADTLGWQLSPYGSLNRTNIGTQTIVVPVLNSTGLLIDQDDTATEGNHTSANQQTLGAQQFIVGTDEFSVVARVVMGDWTDSAFKVGFRIKAAYTATFNSYTDIAAIGNGSSAAGTTWINGDLIVTNAGLNSAAHVQAISAVAPADAVSVEFRIHVAIDGTVTAYADDVAFPIYSVGTTTMKFDTGDALIPFYQHVNIGGGDPAVSISEFVAVADAYWKIDA